MTKKGTPAEEFFRNVTITPSIIKIKSHDLASIAAANFSQSHIRGSAYLLHYNGEGISCSGFTDGKQDYLDTAPAFFITNPELYLQWSLLDMYIFMDYELKNSGLSCLVADYKSREVFAHEIGKLDTSFIIVPECRIRELKPPLNIVTDLSDKDLAIALAEDISNTANHGRACVSAVENGQHREIYFENGTNIGTKQRGNLPDENIFILQFPATEVPPEKKKIYLKKERVAQKKTGHTPRKKPALH